jgi:hypothetical protein
MTTNLTLPYLPSGYFWRVARGAFHIDQIELRKKFLWFSIRIDHLVLDYRDESGDPVEPAAEINRVAHLLSGRFLPKHKESHSWDAFYGDYRAADRSQ